MAKGKGSGGAWAEAQSIVQESGIKGLYRGWGPSIVLCINPAISFAAFEQLKLRVLRRRGLGVNVSLPSFDAFLLGAVSKAIATLVTFPFIRIKTLMQVAVDNGPREDDGERRSTRGNRSESAPAPSKSIRGMMAGIWQTEGLRGLYIGVLPQLLKGVIASAVLFAAKERIFEFVRAVVLTVLARRLKERS